MKNKEELRDELIQELWQMNKMDIIVHLMEFIEGETAALGFLSQRIGMRVNPSQISEELNISRARTANILRSLRNKGLIAMEIDDDDRRKMHVALTEAGRDFFRRKYAFIVRYFSQPMVARHPVRMMVMRDDYREQQKHAGNQTDVCRDSFFLHNGDKGTFFLYNIKYRRLLFRLFATKLQGRG